MQLLKTLCSIPAPSGNESAMTEFLLRYIEEQKKNWNVQPEIYHGEDFQDCIVLIFGKPRTAVYAHIDSIGFTVRYDNQLVKIGSPDVKEGYVLKGINRDEQIEYPITIQDKTVSIKAPLQLERGTELVFKDNWRETEEYVQCCYMDNRLGVWNALMQCQTLTDGAIVFSCWEEHGGGSVPYLTKFLFEKYKIRQALISDITWVTEGVHPGDGVVISLRDTGLPRKSFIERIIKIAKESRIPFQLEVEGSGGSDGTEIQKQPYPIDWCFIGAPEENVHSPDEKVNKKDIESMVSLYRELLQKM